jgi:O-antigen/teichoic acid export membrane protein
MPLDMSAMRLPLIAILKKPAVMAAGAVLTLRGLTLASRFLLSVLLAQMLSPEAMGEYGLLTAVIAFGLLGIGLEFYSHTLRIMVAASPEKRTQIIADQMMLGIMAFVLIAILTLCAVLLRLLPLNLALWFLLVLAIEHVSLEATRILIITSRPVRAYIGVFLRGGIWVYALCLVMFAWPSSRSLETVLLCWAGGGILSVAFAAFSLSDLPWRSLKPYRPDRAWICAGIMTARPFILTAAGALTVSYLDRFLIDGFVGRDALGIYTFYSTILIGLLSLGSSISQQFLPKVIAGFANGADAYRKIHRSFFLTMVALAGGMVVIIGGLIWPVLWFLNLPDYTAHLTVFYLMLPGIFLRIVADVPSYTLYAAHSDGKLLVCNLGGAFVSVALNFVLIPTFGIHGAALSGNVASAVLLLSLTVFSRQVVAKSADKKKSARPGFGERG